MDEDNYFRHNSCDFTPRNVKISDRHKKNPALSAGSAAPRSRIRLRGAAEVEPRATQGDARLPPAGETMHRRPVRLEDCRGRNHRNELTTHNVFYARAGGLRGCPLAVSCRHSMDSRNSRDTTTRMARRSMVNSSGVCPSSSPSSSTSISGDDSMRIVPPRSRRMWRIS